MSVVSLEKGTANPRKSRSLTLAPQIAFAFRRSHPAGFRRARCYRKRDGKRWTAPVRRRLLFIDNIHGVSLRKMSWGRKFSDCPTLRMQSIQPMAAPDWRRPAFAVAVAIATSPPESGGMRATVRKCDLRSEHQRARFAWICGFLFSSCPFATYPFPFFRKKSTKSFCESTFSVKFPCVLCVPWADAYVHNRKKL
ncbi:hypothetical protein McpAg1_13890 [Methanocorpusculaceae archaeon Ag1]|uniref:Uncharacterized protein n=1 Tax=Methanorbis furvi TaxID=3028299 RepID=A0AAE4MBQ3_9EURY|nr:hypothetical protein [Methanocorpusculaceae archaeon Ag1]